MSAILQDLRRLVAGVDHSLRPKVGRLPFGVPDLDAALGGGLARGSVHELSPKTPHDQGCMTGLAIILAALAAGPGKPIVWIQHDFVAMEYGRLYGLGLERLGLSLKRLVTLRVPREPLALWAMEEALKCCAAAAVIAELPGEGAAADLVATRRLVLAAEEGQALGLLLRMKTTGIPSAAMTRWEVASAPSVRDCFGGLGRPAFDLSLLRNRRGPSGRWTLYWNDHGFTPVSLDLAAPSPHRSDHARAQAG